MLRTLKSVMRQDREKFKDPQECPAGDPHPEDLERRNFSGGEK